MASTSEPPSDCSIEKHLICPICKETFTDPVTTSCGHSFCMKCLDFSINTNNWCPLCKTCLSRTPDANVVLRDIVQQIKTQMENADVYTGVAGEVACEVCIQPKLKATKSCLMCPASYCSIHLASHYTAEKFKGHKLVEPVENLDTRACLKHGRPLELYSRKQQRCICVRCMEEGQEDVVSTEEEWIKKKAHLENTKTELQQKITMRQTKMDEINTALKSCKDQLDNEWWDIEAVFTAVQVILEEAKESVLRPLEDRRKLLEIDARGFTDELEAELTKLERTISELDDISVLEDHILFHQKYPSLSFQDNMNDWADVKLDTSLSFGIMRETTTNMIDKIQQELEKLASIELKRLLKFTVDVKMDPNTAHQRLVLSKDGKEVRDGGQNQEVADSPERFDLFGSVLGINCLTSGRSYWEMEVGNKTGWDLGVVRGGANRKGTLTVSPDEGYWVLVHYEEEKYAAMTEPPVGLFIEKKPERVGVFVDYEEGLVSFYDVKSQSHIYTFKGCAFNDDLYPYFSPHMVQDGKNAEPLVIFSEGNEMDEVWREFCAICLN